MREWSLVVMLLITLPLGAQSGADIDAAIEAFLAKDLNTVAHFVPEPLEKALLEANEEERAHIEGQALFAENMKRSGVEAVRDETGQSLLVIRRIDDPSRIFTRISVSKRICDGSESMLRLAIQYEFGGSGTLEVWMRFVDGQWRIYEVKRPWSDDRISLDSEELVERIRHPQIFRNEAEAVSSLGAYSRSIEAFAEINDGQLPASLDQLAPRRDDEGFRVLEDGVPPVPWIEPELVTPPYEYSGYRFQYIPINSGEEGLVYAVLARPIEYRLSGRKSYYMDQSGQVLSTYEDRDASRNDPVDGVER